MFFLIPDEHGEQLYRKLRSESPLESSECIVPSNPTRSNSMQQRKPSVPSCDGYHHLKYLFKLSDSEINIIVADEAVCAIL